VELLPEDQQTKARIALVGTGVLALSFAAYAKDRADSATEAWARECQP
jgi:hypothetical protein